MAKRAGKRAAMPPRSYVAAGRFGRWETDPAGAAGVRGAHLRVTWVMPPGGEPVELAAAVLQHVAFLVLDRWRLETGTTFKAVVGLGGVETVVGSGSSDYTAWLKLRNGTTALTAEGFVALFRLLPASTTDGDAGRDPGLTVRVREATDAAFTDTGFGLHAPLRVPVVSVAVPSVRQKAVRPAQRSRTARPARRRVPPVPPAGPDPGKP